MSFRECLAILLIGFGSVTSRDDVMTMHSRVASMINKWQEANLADNCVIMINENIPGNSIKIFHKNALSKCLQLRCHYITRIQ